MRVRDLIVVVLLIVGLFIGAVYFMNIKAREMEQNSAPLIQALSKYKNDHGRFPSTLDEIIPHYITEVPKCQPSSKNLIPYHYDKSQDAYTLSCGTGGFNKHRYSSSTGKWDDWD